MSPKKELLWGLCGSIRFSVASRLGVEHRGWSREGAATIQAQKCPDHTFLRTTCIGLGCLKQSFSKKPAQRSDPCPNHSCGSTPTSLGAVLKPYTFEVAGFGAKHKPW